MIRRAQRLGVFMLLAAATAIGYAGLAGCSSSSSAHAAGSPHADSGAADSTASVVPDGGGPSDSGRSGDTTASMGSCADAGCAAQMETCNPQTGMCVQCMTNTDCVNMGGPLMCDTTMNLCVDCLKASDCPYDSPGCAQGFCGGCYATSDCPADNTCAGAGSDDGGMAGTCTCQGNTGCGGDAPVCTAGVCGCAMDSQCPSGQRCDTVDFPTGLCFVPCTADAGACDPTSFVPYCMTTSGMCVECLTDPQCVGEDAGVSYCVQGACDQCRTYMDCPASAPGCDSSSNNCGTCTLNTDCPPGYTCAAATDTCVTGDGGITDAGPG